MLLRNEEQQYRLSRLPFAQKINAVLDSTPFLLVVAAVMLIANLCAKELVFYGFCGVLMLYLGLFGTDFRLLIAMFINCYITPSLHNNPGLNADSVFSFDKGGFWILVYGAMALTAFLYRCAVDPAFGFSRWKKGSKLLPGLLLLGGAYLLSGIGSEGYADIAKSNIVFALIQLIAVLGPFLVLIGGVQWEKLQADYLATIGLLVGLCVGAQVCSIYFMKDVVLESGRVSRSLIFTGWGNYNNMAVLIAMAVPFAFYFVYKGKNIVLNNLLAAMLVGFSILSCSRAGIIGACVIYLICAVAVLLKTKSKGARISVIVGLSIAALAFVSIFFFVRGSLIAAFESGLNSDARLNLYKAGLQAFGERPIFGNSFFHLNRLASAEGGDSSWIFADLTSFNDFFPGRWHNTFIQMAAGCGIVGLLAYLFHRYQTLRLVLKRPNAEKIFAALSIAVLLTLSMVDCHLFNVGPALFYSSMLAFMEKRPVSNDASPKCKKLLDE